MAEPTLQPGKVSKTRIIASSGVFQIEYIESVGLNDYPALIHISEALAEDFGKPAILTHGTIQRYFNRKGSLPFIARYRGEIIGYIIGVQLEALNKESWARVDPNFGQLNTLYTYAFVIKSKFKGNGYAKMLKRVYLNWAKKQGTLQFVTGHVKLGISSKFSGDIKIINRVEYWQGTGHTFEYYRRNIDPENLHSKKNR